MMPDQVLWLMSVQRGVLVEMWRWSDSDPGTFTYLRSLVMNRRQIEKPTLYILELHLGEVTAIEGTVRGSEPDEVEWLVVSMRLAATKSLIAHPRKFNSSALTIHI